MRNDVPNMHECDEDASTFLCEMVYMWLVCEVTVHTEKKVDSGKTLLMIEAELSKIDHPTTLLILLQNSLKTLQKLFEELFENSGKIH